MADEVVIVRVVDDVLFVKYVPPPCDDEVTITQYHPPSFYGEEERPATPVIVWQVPESYWVNDMPPLTPVWIDQWEDLDTDPSPDYKPNN